MLSAQSYSDLAEGPAIQISGQLFANGRWHVSAFLHERPNGTWRVGRETDSEVYVLNHLFASVPAGCGPYRAATKTEKRELLQQIYQWIDQQTGHGSTNQTKPGSSKEISTMATQCVVFTKWGRGPRCSKQAAIGQDICKTHSFLEKKLGPLPRQPVTEPAAPVEVAGVSTGEAIMRATPADGVTEVDFAAPTEVPAAAPAEVPVVPVEQQEPKVRKTRKDKGTTRKRR